MMIRREVLFSLSSYDGALEKSQFRDTDALDFLLRATLPFLLSVIFMSCIFVYQSHLTSKRPRSKVGIVDWPIRFCIENDVEITISL